ncbi:hypothetical protein [Corynebacterium sp. 335C]
MSTDAPRSRRPSGTSRAGGHDPAADGDDEERSRRFGDLLVLLAVTAPALQLLMRYVLVPEGQRTLLALFCGMVVLEAAAILGAGLWTGLGTRAQRVVIPAAALGVTVLFFVAFAVVGV